MTLEKIKQKLAPIESLAHPDETDYMRMAIDGKMETLYKLSRKVPYGGTIVEIDSLYGSTAILMALASKPSVKIYCIELKVLPELTKHIKEYGVSSKITIHAGKSCDIGRLWEIPIDLLFIDGDHSYNGVINDNKTWIPYVKKEGIIVWHDYYNKRPGYEAGQAVDNFLDGSEKEFEIIMPETVEKIIRVVRKK